MSLKSSQEAPLNEAELANEAWWAWIWEEIEHLAFLGVVVALAIEFAALKFAAPHKKKLDDARELKMSQLATEAATAKAEQERLKSLVTWRALSLDQRQRLANHLGAAAIAKPTLPRHVLLSYAANDPEAQYLALHLRATLLLSSWQPTPLQARTTPSLPVFGIYIPPPDNETVTMVRDAFRAADIPFEATPIPDAVINMMGVMPGPAAAEIFVGSRRQPTE